jgi:hypothetical protein
MRSALGGQQRGRSSRLLVDEVGIVVPSDSPEHLADGRAMMARRIDEKPTLHESVRKNIESRFNVAALVQETSNALLFVQ